MISRRSSPPRTTDEDTYSARWAVAVAAVSALIGGFLVRLSWSQHEHFGTFGFDTGIFTQGTWLLAHGHSPFVTIRGLNLFGDHASYILALVAPLYRLLPDPRLLLFLQVIGVVLPSLAIYRIGRDKVGPRVAFAVASGYVIYPAMNHAALWQFHPETFAAGLLSLGALFAHLKHYRLMGLMLLLGVLCKEDVGLVIAGFGLYLVLTGVRRIGLAVMLSGATYFLFVTFVIIKWVNGGQGSIYTARLYGIEGEGIGVVIQALPQLLWHAFIHATSPLGISYLGLVFAPMLFLPIMAPRALLPIAGPMLLNLASTTEYQRSIEYQYLATSAPFIALAAVYALEKIGPVRRRGVLAVAVIVVSLPMAYRYGPFVNTVKRVYQPLPAVDVGRNAVLNLVPSNAAVSAQANTTPHLANRTEIYEFPNPFRPSNWGRDDAPVAPEVAARVKYVVVDPRSFGNDDLKTYLELRKDPSWEVVYNQGVVLLKRP